MIWDTREKFVFVPIITQAEEKCLVMKFKGTRIGVQIPHSETCTSLIDYAINGMK